MMRRQEQRNARFRLASVADKMIREGRTISHICTELSVSRSKLYRLLKDCEINTPGGYVAESLHAAKRDSLLD